MCVQQHNIEEESEIWAGCISADITKHNLKAFFKTSCLVQVENKKATFAHELLTTALLKTATANRCTCIFIPLVEMCDVDVFLQHLRPTDSTNSDLYLEFTYNYSSQISRNLGKICAYKLA